MGYGRSFLRIARMVAAALVLAAVGALSLPHLGPGAGVAQAQVPPREAPQISALIQATTSSIAVVWLPADNTDLHWLYAVKADGTGARFLPAVPDPPQGASGQGGVSGVSHVTTVSGLDADTTYWFAVLGIRAPSDSSPSTWFRWSNWGTGTTRAVPTVSLVADMTDMTVDRTVAEGSTATFTVRANPAPQAPLTVNYAIGIDGIEATVDGDSGDYSGTATGSLTIATGATEGSIAVAITDDSDIDDGAQEILLVTISLPPGSSYQLGETASATLTITEGVCDRTAAVRTAMLDALTGTSDCAAVTDADLSGITGTLDLSSESLTAVQARDFLGLSGLEVLRLNHNSLGSLPADVFDGLTSLQELYLNHNALAALPEDVFDGLTNLTTLSLSNTSLAALEANVFDGLSSLTTLRLNNNASLAALPGEVFDGLSSLATLRLNNNALTALPDGVFDGLTGLEGLYLAGNPGSAFTFTAAVAQTVATDVTVAVAQAAPFDMSVTLAVQGGTPSTTSVVVAAGSRESPATTVTPSGDAPVTVSVTAASFPASGVAIDGVTVTYNGLQTGLGAANQAPTADAGLDQPVATGATATLDASGSSDADSGDTLSYRWTQTAGATVTLSSPTAASPTFTAPSSAATLTFQVTVMDGRGGSDRDTVDITVSGNAPPAFSSPPTFSLPENTTAVDTVTAVDPDTEDSVTGYTLSGTDAALFAITSAGVLTFSTAPDFEAPAGGATDDANSYALTVTATGGTGARALTATQALTVTVTDANEAPTITSGPTFSLAENSTAVGTVVAGDPDTADSVTGYTLSGTDAGLFAITSVGALSFSAAPDFEDPQGGASDDANSYDLTVAATGGAGARALTVTQDLTVTVTDVNDAPAITSSPTFSLAEHTTAVGTVVAADPDADDSVTGYSLSGTDAGLFAITSAGVLTFSTAPDFEVPQGGASDDANSYTLTVTATGGAGARALTATQALTVTVTDVNEAPTIISGPIFSLAENTTAVGTVIAADPDADDSVTGYALSGTDAGLFAITSAGVLTFSTAPDFEDPQGGASDDANSYDLTVTATGGTGARALTATQNLTVTVTDVDEPLTATISGAPTTHDGATTFTFELHFSENVDIGYATLRDDAFDVTGGTVDGASRLVPGSNQGWTITLEPAGHTDVTIVLPVTTDCAATGAVCTAGGQMLSARVEVTVTDVNDPPTITSSATFSLAENTTTVDTVVATDPDVADSVTFALSGTDAALFEITTAGALSFRSAPNFENPQGGAIDDSNSYTLTVTATGGTGGRARTTTQALTVNVTDANDPPTITSDPTFSLAENTTAVGTVTATDSDPADSITGYTLSGTDASLFAITSAGVLTFSTAPDFEEPEGGADDDSNDYEFTFTATSGTGARALTGSQNLTVTVTDVTEAPGTPSLAVTGVGHGTRATVTATILDDGGSPITAVRFYVERRVPSHASESQRNWFLNTDATDSASPWSVQFTTYSIGSHYRVRARAQNAVGWGPWTAWDHIA